MACNWIVPARRFYSGGWSTFHTYMSFHTRTQVRSRIHYGLRGAAPAGGPVPSPFVRARAAPTSLRVVHWMLDALDMSCAPIMEPRAAVPPALLLPALDSSPAGAGPSTAHRTTAVVDGGQQGHRHRLSYTNGGQGTRGL